MIEPEYYSAWFNLVEQAKQRYGWTMPVYIEQYISAVLANYVDKPDWQPDPSWAETLLQIQNAHAAKVLGDQAFFAACVFPTMLLRKGIDHTYFYNIGQTSYHFAEQINQELFGTMSRNFVFLSQCVRQTIADNPGLSWYKQ
jgi:hypothetical protein